MGNSVAYTWGTDAAERSWDYACDAVMPEPESAAFRGVTIDAPTQVVYRWLCQMRAAPYSYDWIDNLGRRSPRVLIEGLENLEVGQRVMTIFRLVDFEEDRQVTIRMAPGSKSERIFGALVVTYLVEAIDESKCRLVVKLVGDFPEGAWGRFMKVFLPWGDLVMMRKQLLTFKKYAENHPLHQISW